MKKWTLIALLPLLLFGCKSKKKLLTDEENITIADFIAFFEDIKPPVYVADSSFVIKKTDTAFIRYKTFVSLLPDSLLSPVFGRNGHPKLYPIGKIAVKKSDTYLLMKAISPTQKAAYVLVFDKDNKFAAGMPLLVEDNNPATEQTAFMDNKYSITSNRQYKAADGRLMYKKAAYAYISGTNAFALILTETNETEMRKDVLNPIDTVSRKNRLAGDYLQNKLNLVSVRDARRPGYLLVFVHFEQPGGCKGELKGEAKITAPGKAVYRQSGDPCVLELTFSGNRVSLNEEGCGAHRDIKCFFEGSFIKKPAPRPAKAVKSTKHVKAA